MPHLLFLSFATLLLGPVLFHTAQKNTYATRFLDAFVLCSVFGLVLFHVLPESFSTAGLWAVVATLLGLFAPLFFGRFIKTGGCHLHASLLSLASLGLLSHALLDGMALARAAFSPESITLAIAVVLHRLPEGAGIWRVMNPRLGKQMALVVLLVVMGTTALGYYFGETLNLHASSQTLALFEGLMAGVLLHVIFHREHLDPVASQSAPLNRQQLSISFGALCGVMLVLGLFAVEPEEDHQNNAVIEVQQDV